MHCSVAPGSSIARCFLADLPVYDGLQAASVRRFHERRCLPAETLRPAASVPRAPLPARVDPPARCVGSTVAALACGDPTGSPASVRLDPRPPSPRGSGRRRPPQRAASVGRCVLACVAPRKHPRPTGLLASVRLDPRPPSPRGSGRSLRTYHRRNHGHYTRFPQRPR